MVIEDLKLKFIWSNEKNVLFYVSSRTAEVFKDKKLLIYLLKQDWKENFSTDHQLSWKVKTNN